MSPEFPYQLTIFLDRFPDIGESVYAGARGWYAQVAIKRRFGLVGIDEATLIETLKEYFSHMRPFEIALGDVARPDRMPVAVIEPDLDNKIIRLHHDIIAFLGSTIVSRFPERDGENYYPHVTAEYDGKQVIDTAKYIQHTFTIVSIWLLKDVNDRNSVAFKEFPLDSHSE